MTEELKPIFEKPYGRSERDWGHQATEEEILCETCGTRWAASYDVSISWVYFQNRQLVIACCGKFVDEIYEQWGDMFMESYLNDFVRDPTNPRFIPFRAYQLPGALEGAKRLVSRTDEEIDRAIGQL